MKDQAASAALRNFAIRRQQYLEEQRIMNEHSETDELLSRFVEGTGRTGNGSLFVDWDITNQPGPSETANG